MKFDNKSFQEKYEAWKNGADYWKDIRGINLGGDTQVDNQDIYEDPQIKQRINSIVDYYDDYPAYKHGKGSNNDYINAFVHKMGPLVGRQLGRYGYGREAYYNVMRQLGYESNYGRSNIARRQHNYGGVGFNGKKYNSYKSDEDFVKDYVRLMHKRYRSALKAKSTQDYARELKRNGYYTDTLAHYTSQLRGMDSLAKAAFNHRYRNPNMYNYNVKFNDVVQDYNDAKNTVTPNQPIVEVPVSTRVQAPVVPFTLSKEQVQAQQQQFVNQQRQKMYDAIATPALPNILDLLPQNNFGKDAYGQKFWQRRGRNLHFKEGKDKQSFNDWANKISKYKNIQIYGDPTYDYKGWYNENPNRAYALLKDDPSAHFDDKWKTPLHPTFSDQSVYSNAKHPGGHWGRFDYRDAYYAPIFSYTSPEDRIAYLNIAEDNGAIPLMNNGALYRVDGDLYGGVLPAVQVEGKRGKK